jgi:hypothetical protein
LNVAETLLEYEDLVKGPDASRYRARAVGTETPGGTWQGWIEFTPIGGGAPVRSPRETTQPNHADTVYWATGLTPVYLEGALARALTPTRIRTPAEPAPPVFDRPAPPVRATVSATGDSVLDPFSVYEKGETLLRRQLGAMSAWHLVNIIVSYDLSREARASLELMPAAALIETIIEGVRQRVDRPAAQRR